MRSTIRNTFFVVRRRFSTGADNNHHRLEEWIKINAEMEKKAADVANKEIQIRTSTLQADIYGLREQVSGLKADFQLFKTDMQRDIQRDFQVFSANIKTDLANGIKELHKQQTSNLRLTLMGIFGIASAAVGVNQYLQTRNNASKSTG